LAVNGDAPQAARALPPRCSLATPGTHATGISLLASEMGAKRMQILNEIFPKARRVGVAHSPADRAGATQLGFV
jgi:hypothetical protein